MSNIELKWKCDRLLQSLVGITLVNKWWNSHNKAFNKTPQEQFDTDPESVYNYLLKHSEGEW